MVSATEAAAIQLLGAEHAWTVQSGGWPDLLVSRMVGGRQVALGIELKSRTDALTMRQRLTLGVMRKGPVLPLGVRVSPEGYIEAVLSPDPYNPLSVATAWVARTPPWGSLLSALEDYVIQVYDGGHPSYLED